MGVNLTGVNLNGFEASHQKCLTLGLEAQEFGSSWRSLDFSNKAFGPLSI